MLDLHSRRALEASPSPTVPEEAAQRKQEEQRKEQDVTARDRKDRDRDYEPDECEAHVTTSCEHRGR